MLKAAWTRFGSLIVCFARNSEPNVIVEGEASFLLAGADIWTQYFVLFPVILKSLVCSKGHMVKLAPKFYGSTSCCPVYLLFILIVFVRFASVLEVFKERLLLPLRLMVQLVCPTSGAAGSSRQELLRLAVLICRSHVCHRVVMVQSILTYTFCLCLPTLHACLVIVHSLMLR